MRLYHFTCEHSARGISENGGLIVPRFHPYIGFSVVWMTYDPGATREQLGLSSHSLGCDRMAYRFEIESPDTAVAWNTVRDRYKHARLLEATPGTRPSLWFVSRMPQRTTPLADVGEGRC